MSGIVAVLTDLPFHKRAPIRRDGVDNARFGMIAEDGDNHVKSPAIAEPAEDKGGIAPEVPVVVSQPRFEAGRILGSFLSAMALAISN